MLAARHDDDDDVEFTLLKTIHVCIFFRNRQKLIFSSSVKRSFLYIKRKAKCNIFREAGLTRRHGSSSGNFFLFCKKVFFIYKNKRNFRQAIEKVLQKTIVYPTSVCS